MSNLNRHHRRRPSPRRASRSPGRWRALAALLCALVAFAAIAPAWAVAGELDIEGEGTGAAGPLPGLEEGPEFEPGGEEPALEEQPPLPGEEVEEEAPPEVEAAGQVEATAPEAPPPPAPEAEAVVPEAAPQVEAPPVAEAPPGGPPIEGAPPPTYETELAPTYEPAPPSAAPVENEAIVAPPAAEGRMQRHSQETAGPVVVEAPPPAPAEAPEPAPAPTPTPPAAQAPEREAVAGTLAGHRSHTVRPGECLWSIAEALLPAGASNTQIAAEVHRLWQLNAERIGSGDPNLIFVGTRLRLR